MNKNVTREPETKLGISSSSLFPLGIKSTFQVAEHLGYDGVEVMITADKKTRDESYIKMLQDKFQIPVLSLHAPTLIATHFVWGTDALNKLKKTAELAQSLNTPTVVVHPPFIYQSTYVESFISTLNSLEEETGVVFAVENMFPWNFKGKTKEMYAPDWGTISEQSNSLTLDFSHAALSGLDTLQFVEQHHGKIKHFHVCDGVGVKTKKRNGTQANKLFDEHLAPGEGTQPILEVFELLNRNSWVGSLVAEVRTGSKMNLDNKMVKLDDTLQYMKKIYNS